MRNSITRWEPEAPEFWRTTGSRIAWRTLVITTVSLFFSFATWFTVSAVVVRLPAVGFRYTTMELFWLTAAPGLAGGTFRIIHSFLIPIFGTRMVIGTATWIKLFPVIGLAFALINPGTPFWLFFLFAFLLGFGGGDFSSFMPSTSLFFPKRLQGTALGIQAGLGNLGVSVAQFVTPWIIGFAAFGGIVGSSQITKKGDTIWLQNAFWWYVPFLIILTIICYVFLRAVPVKASFREQMDIFKTKHTWFCTITYVMTFGSFSGFSAAFPLMIKTIYGNFPNAPDPLAYAFLGPLVGSVARFAMGPFCDKFGGSIFTQLSGAGLITGCAVLILGGYLTPASLDYFPAFVGIMLWIFLMTGIGNAATFRQYPIIFAHSPRQGAGVLGWTGAIAAYGPFIFASLIGFAITGTGSAVPFFAGIIVYYLLASCINWWYYTRRGAERWDWGNRWGTWWDKAKHYPPIV